MDTLKDLFRFAPAPTLVREARVTVIGGLVLAVVIAYAWSSDGNWAIWALAAAVAVYLLLRLGYRAARPEPRPDKPDRQP